MNLGDLDGTPAEFVKVLAFARLLRGLCGLLGLLTLLSTFRQLQMTGIGVNKSAKEWP